MEILYFNNIKFILLNFVFLLFATNSFGQLERKLVQEDKDVELTFNAPRNINFFTVEPVESKGLHFNIMHTFGELNSGVQDLWGIDGGANIQFGFEYGLNDKTSVGITRQSLDKVYTLYGRQAILVQNESDSRPISISAFGGVSMNTSDYDFLGDDKPSSADRMMYTAQLMFARKFSDKFSLQLSPIVSYFADANPIFLIDTEEQFNAGLAVSSKYRITRKSYLTFQYMENLNNGLNRNFGIGIDIETGGHVFQMYFVTSRALAEPYLLAVDNGDIGGDFRIGFNVNRIFGKPKRNVYSDDD